MNTNKSYLGIERPVRVVVAIERCEIDGERELRAEKRVDRRARLDNERGSNDAERQSAQCDHARRRIDGEIRRCKR